MIYPVPILKGIPPKVSQGFGGGSGNHKGVDIMYRRDSKGATQLPVFSPHYWMPSGVPALAWRAGKVTRSSVIGTGGRVRIDHGNGFESAYYHLQGLKVRVGQVVKAGQPVGNIYHNVTGYKLNHLHFEILRNGNYVDPSSYIHGSKRINNPNKSALWIAGAAIISGLVASRYVFF